MEIYSTLLDLCEGNPPVTSGFPSQSQWLRTLIFLLICVWTKSWVNNRDAGLLRCHFARYDATVMERRLLPWFLRRQEKSSNWLCNNSLRVIAGCNSPWNGKWWWHKIIDTTDTVPKGTCYWSIHLFWMKLFFQIFSHCYHKKMCQNLVVRRQSHDLAAAFKFFVI